MVKYIRSSSASTLWNILVSAEPPDSLMLTEFYSFCKLPTELQLQIWRMAYAAQAPRTLIPTVSVPITFRGTRWCHILKSWTQNSTTNSTTFKNCNAALLQVCHRAREECLPLYTQLSGPLAKKFSQSPVYFNPAIDKLRIRDYGQARQGILMDFTYKDVIREFQHFEIVVTPSFLPSARLRSQADIGWLNLLAENLMKRTRKPVLSITIVISWSSQAEIDDHKFCEAKEREQKTRIQEEIATVGKWGDITINDGPLKGMLVSARVYPFRETEVFLEHVYPYESCMQRISAHLRRCCGCRKGRN